MDFKGVEAELLAFMGGRDERRQKSLLGKIIGPAR